MPKLPAPPIPRLTLITSTSSSVMTSSSSPGHFFPSSPLPPTPIPLSHIHCHVCRPPPRSCTIAKCVRDDQFSVLPLSLYEEDFNVHSRDADWQTDATVHEEREQRSRAMLRVFLGLGTVRSRMKMILKVSWTSMSPRMDINSSSSSDCTRKVSPTSIHAKSPCQSISPLTHTASAEKGTSFETRVGCYAYWFTAMGTEWGEGGVLRLRLVTRGAMIVRCVAVAMG